MQTSMEEVLKNPTIGVVIVFVIWSLFSLVKQLIGGVSDETQVKTILGEVLAETKEIRQWQTGEATRQNGEIQTLISNNTEAIKSLTTVCHLMLGLKEKQLEGH